MTIGRNRSKFGWRPYEQSTAPLIELYNKLGLLVQVAAPGAPDEIFDRKVGEMESRRVRVFAYKLWDAARIVSQFSNRDTPAPLFPRFEGLGYLRDCPTRSNAGILRSLLIPALSVAYVDHPDTFR